MKLFEIPIEAHEIEQELAENYGELTPEIEQRIADFLRQGKDKIENAAVIVRQLEGDAELCRKEAERLTARADGLTKGAMRLKALTLFALDEGFGGKIKTALFTIWAQTSAAMKQFNLKPGASIYSVPPEFLRTKDPELDKLALKGAADEGLAIPDSIDVAEVPGVRYLRIR
jgi:Siphovirus Gp157